MAQAGWRRMRWVLAIMALALLAACSVLRLAYNQAHNYAYWRMDKAFDLDASQHQMAKGAIADWFTWHRNTQLPLYTRFIERAQQDARGPITAALACERRREIEGWMKASAERAAPPLARVAVSLSPAQIDHLAEHFKDKNEDFEDEFLQKDSEDRRKAADKFAVKWIERFYGRLDGAQRKQVSAEVARLPFDANTMNQQRLRFQSRYLDILRKVQSEKLSAAQAEPLIRAALLDMIEPSDPALRASMAQWNNAGCQMATNVHNRINAKQRETLIERLKGWELDLRELTKPSAQAPAPR